MAASALLLALLSALAVFQTESKSDGALIALRELRDQSPSKVVSLTDELVRKIFEKKGEERSFSVLVFFYVANLESENPALKLDHLKSEFQLAATTYHKTHVGTDRENAVFFCIADVKESNMAFQVFKVEALPHISLAKGNSKRVNMAWDKFSRNAEGIAQFLTGETGIPVGDITRPPMFSKAQIAVMVAFFLGLLPFVVKFLVNNKTPIHNPWTWCLGGLFVYFFSVSGGMYNIIRGMPPFMRDQKDPNKLVFWYSSSGAQFWVEGFSIGGLYMLFGLLLSLITFVAPRLQSRQLQRGLVLGSIFACYFAVKQLVSIDNWKTGYSIHGFFPRSWR